MDQEADYENFEEEPNFEDYTDDQITAPPLESAFSKYLREYRLLNSLLISLVLIIAFFVAMWNIVVYVAAAGDGDADFSDAGTAPAQQNQEKKKVVKLMQRQKKAQPKAQQTFRTTAISDITLPDMNELDVKDLAPVVEAAAPSMSDAGMNNDAMKSAFKGIGLFLPKTMQQRCDPKKRIERLRSGGGKDMTEGAIMRGLNWLKAVQDEDGGWGNKDKNDQGQTVKTDRDAMTGMALLAYLGHCELQDSPTFRSHSPKRYRFSHKHPPDKPVGVVIKDHITPHSCLCTL